MEYALLAFVFVMNLIMLALGYGISMLLNSGKERHTVHRIDLRMPEIQVKHKQENPDANLMPHPQAEEFIKLQKEFFEKDAKREDDRKNRKNGDIKYKDLNQTVNQVYDAFMNGDTLTEGDNDEQE